MIKKAYQFIVGGMKNDLKVFLLYLLSFVSGSRSSIIKTIDENRLKELVKSGQSLIRLGDGEAMLMMGRDIHYQSSSNELTKKLRQIVSSYNGDTAYCLGIPTDQVESSQDKLKAQDRLRIWRLFRVFFKHRFHTKEGYYSAVLFYHHGVFEKIITPSLQNKNLICVSRQGVLDETLLSYLRKFTTNVDSVVVPDKESYSVIDETKKQISEKIKQHPELTPIILLAAGPASKIIAYDFTKLGIQALDIGLGMEIIGRDLDYSNRI